jgi:hypothetical protein
MTAKLRTNRSGHTDHRTVEMDLLWSDSPNWLSPREEVSKFDEISAWVEGNKFGKRISYNMWRMNGPELATLFLLKWN